MVWQPKPLENTGNPRQNRGHGFSILPLTALIGKIEKSRKILEFMAFYRL